MICVVGFFFLGEDRSGSDTNVIDNQKCNCIICIKYK
jgi:hypothetical protein